MTKNNINQESWQPVYISGGSFDAELLKLESYYSRPKIIDQCETNLKELFLLRNPKYKFDKNYKGELEEFVNRYNDKNFGNWFYFPWLGVIVRYFPEDLHQELRTGRNKYLITDTEQASYYYSTAVVLGLSVGSHIAQVIAMTGGCKKIKLADPDSISGDNLNRIRVGFSQVGLNKAVVVARQIFEINPYAKIDIYTDGLHERNAEEILEGADVVIEEMDNPYWKLKVRELCRERGIPVLMGTDNGDGAIIDIERFDVKKNYPILHGKIGKLTAESLKTMLAKDLPKVAGKIAGANLTVPKMLYSVSEVGRSLYSWPQLGTAANICGSVISMLIRRILNKDKNIKSGRYSVNLDSIFESDYKRKFFSRKVALIQFIREMMRRGKSGN